MRENLGVHDDKLMLETAIRFCRENEATKLKEGLPSQYDGHGTMRCNMCHGIGDLIKTLFNVGWDGEDITNVA